MGLERHRKQKWQLAETGCRCQGGGSNIEFLPRFCLEGLGGAFACQRIQGHYKFGGTSMLAEEHMAQKSSQGLGI